MKKLLKYILYISFFIAILVVFVVILATLIAVTTALTSDSHKSFSEVLADIKFFVAIFLFVFFAFAIPSVVGGYTMAVFSCLLGLLVPAIVYGIYILIRQITKIVFRGVRMTLRISPTLKTAS